MSMTDPRTLPCRDSQYWVIELTMMFPGGTLSDKVAVIHEIVPTFRHAKYLCFLELDPDICRSLTPDIYRSLTPTQPHLELAGVIGLSAFSTCIKIAVMPDYGFFAAHLRFIAAKTPASAPEIAAMMEALKEIADEVETSDRFTLPAGRLESAARGLAGLAGFLQQQILPEVVAAKNDRGEREVRWVIDTAMSMMGGMLIDAEQTPEGESKTYNLPPPPTVLDR